MTIAEIIASREPDWRELERLVEELGKPGFFRKRDPKKIARFAALYRAVCSDLALADSYRLPVGTIRYLNDLIGIAHNRLYRRQTFDVKDCVRVLLFDAPRWIFTDATFWTALALFWIPFLTCMQMAKLDPSFAESVVGSSTLDSMESMYEESFDELDATDRISMAAFYVQHNGGIGLQCFAIGAIGGFPGLFILLSNAVGLGAVFGYMSSGAVSSSISANFAEFTTAHGPFELTAIVMSAAAGMRIGFGLIETNGYSRIDSMRRAAIKASPTMTAAFLLFCFAAFLEAFVSPHPMTLLKNIGPNGIDPLNVKRGIAALSTLVLVLYIGGLGGFSFWRRAAFSFGKNDSNNILADKKTTQTPNNRNDEKIGDVKTPETPSDAPSDSSLGSIDLIEQK